MIEYQRIVDEIVDAVESAALPDADLLRDICAQYAEACVMVNDRLRQCAPLLKKGLRAEAISHCEREPHLLDLISTLDFPKLPEWLELSLEIGLSLPPKIRLEIASQLNEAYAQQQPLDVLLDKHRLLALGRSPLAVRLIVLRRIRELDPDNPSWYDDQVAWEHARSKQIAEESRVAMRRHDEATLTELLRELNESSWINAPDPGLVENVKKAASAEQRRYARIRLEQLVPRLQAAHVKRDVSQGRALLAYWQEDAAIAKLVDSDPLSQQVAPVLVWLSQEAAQTAATSQQQTLIYQLDQAIARGASREELDSHYFALRGIPLPVPADVQQRYENHVVALRSARSRAVTFRWVAIVASVLAVLLLSVTIFQFWNHARQVASSETNLERLINDDKLDEADTYREQVEQSSPDIYASEKFQDAVASLAKAKQKDDERRQKFKQISQQLESTAGEKISERELVELRGLAKTNEEKMVADSWDKIRREALAAQRKTNQLDFQRQLSEGEAKYHEVVSRTPPDDQGLNSLKSELSRLLATASDLSSVDRQAGATLLSRVEAALTDISHAKSLDQQLDQIASKVGDVEQFQRALQQFADAHPEAPESATLAEVAKEADLWRGLLAWSALYSAEEFRGWETQTPASAAKLLGAGNSLLPEHDEFELARDFKVRKEYLEHVAARVDFEGNGIYSSLTDYLAAPLNRDLYELRTKSGKRYFLAKDPRDNPELKNARFSVEYFASYRGDQERVGINRVDLDFVGPAAHCVLSVTIRQAIEAARKQGTLTGPAWETTFHSILNTIQTDGGQGDPIKIGQLFELTLRTAAQGSLVIEEAYANHQEILKQTPIDPLVKWFDPDDQKAQQLRAKLQSSLKSFPTVEATNAAVQMAKTKYQSAVPVGYSWAGWLRREVAGDWRADGVGSTMSAGSLYVVFRPAPNAGPVVQRVANCEDHKITWSTVTSDALRLGRPLFYRPTSQAQP